LAPLALGGADGWMLDGFFENVLLRNFSSTYETLTRDHDRQVWAGDDIRTTFEMLAEMWGRPGALAGGSGRALVQQFPDAVLEVFSYGKAAMVVAPDFAESVIRQFGVPDNEVGTFTFPPVTPPGGPLVIAGDLLVATKPRTDAALDLISYLGTAAAPIPWIRDTGGFIAANPDTDRSFYSPTLARLSDELRTHDVSFDLSDQLGPVGSREGLQLVLQNFVERLGSGTSHAESVRIAVRDMIAAEAR
jgi:alpha-glucoside transport system substrate-binding protein